MAGDVEMANPGDPFAPPIVSAAGDAFEELGELLRDAMGNELTTSELERIMTFVSSPTDLAGRDAHGYTALLSKALEVSIKWEYQYLWSRTIDQFEKLETLVLEPATVVQALRVFKFQWIKPCLDQLVGIDAMRQLDPNESLCFLESLDSLVLRAVGRGTLPSSTSDSTRAFWTWSSSQRQRLCDALLPPKNELEQITLHCLEHGGLSFALTHLLPLYTNDRVNKGTLLCELAVHIDSVKAFPDNDVKNDVVLGLLQTGLGRFYPLTVENHEEQFQAVYAALDVYFKRGGRDRVEALFTRISQEIQAIKAHVPFKSVITGSLYPFLTRVIGELANKHPGVLNLLQTHLDALNHSIAEVILDFLQLEHRKSDQLWLDDATQSRLHAWLAPLVPPDRKIFPVFLSRLKACTDKRRQDLPPAIWRVCFRVLHRLFARWRPVDPVVFLTIDLLVQHYARHHASLNDVKDILREFDLFITTVNSQKALRIFAERFVCEAMSGHSEICELQEVTVLNERFTVLPGIRPCLCQKSPDLVEVMKGIAQIGSIEAANGITKMRGLFPQSEPPDDIASTLAIMVGGWFKKYLLTSPPEVMSEALRAGLANLPPCKLKSGESRICSVVRGYLRGTLYKGSSAIFVHWHDLRPRGFQHVQSCVVDLALYCDLKKHATGTRIGMKDESMWRRAYGRRLLDALSQDEDTLRKVLEEDYQPIRDAVQEPESPKPASRTVGTGNVGATAVERAREVDDMDVSPAKKRKTDGAHARSSSQ